MRYANAFVVLFFVFFLFLFFLQKVSDGMLQAYSTVVQYENNTCKTYHSMTLLITSTFIFRN